MEFPKEQMGMIWIKNEKCSNLRDYYEMYYIDCSIMRDI